MRQTTRIVFLAGAVLLAACPGDGGSLALDDLADELLDVQCARLARCGAYTSAADCKADVNFNLGEITHAVDIGTVLYDGGAARDCLDALAGASCDSTTEGVRVTPDACDRTFVGTVADGGACFDSLECKSQDCGVPDCGMACCAGTCGPTIAEVAIGQSCATAACVDGAFCNAQDVCAALLAANAACEGDGQCGYGLACSGGTCKPSANRGEACLDGDCHDIGDRCDGTTCVGRSAAGGSCSMGFAGLFDCQRPLVCNQQTLRCDSPPTAGQACQFFCAPGLFCNDDSQCEAPRANGAQCTSDGDCASNYCDEFATTPVCAAMPLCG